MTMRLVPAIAIFAALLGTAAAAQQAPPPLQTRKANPADDHPTVVLRNSAKSVLPQDASGLYHFDDADAGKGSNFGEGIQIDEQFGDVTGYLTIKPPSGGGKFNMASYFFSHIEGGGGDLAFTTKAVHGVSYSFEGKLVRGQGLSRADDGFYLMNGELITHDDDHKTTQRKTISLKQTAVR